MAMENPREVEDNHGICSDVLPELESSYEGILKETFMLVVGVLGKLTDLEICNNGAEDSVEGTITSWKDVLQSYTMNLKLNHICDASEKLHTRVVCSFTFCTLSFHMFVLYLLIFFFFVCQQKRLVDCKPETRTSIEVHLNHLHTWLGVILSSAEGILSELLEAHRMVSISCLEKL